MTDFLHAVLAVVLSVPLSFLSHKRSLLVVVLSVSPQVGVFEV